MQQRTWYVAYGSNLAIARFRCYLSGGRPTGGARDYVGCVNPSEPARIEKAALPGGLVFAAESGVWGGGMAFYDRESPHVTACRAYLVTVEQFSDVAAQEARRPPGGEFARNLARLLPTVETVATTGPGWYDTVVRLGELDGVPMFTITHHDIASLRLSPPSAPYLRCMSTGLRESHGYDDARIARYLGSAPGLQGTWTERDILTAIGCAAD
jgi:hypothetical protein